MISIIVIKLGYSYIIKKRKEYRKRKIAIVMKKNMLKKRISKRDILHRKRNVINKRHKKYKRLVKI